MPASIELHGLPMSHPETFGPFVVQRFQRTALQHWVEQVEGGPPAGTVVLVNSGDHYKDLLLADSPVATPHAHDDTRMLDLQADEAVFVDALPATATERVYNVVDDALAEALRLLESVPSATPGLKAARRDLVPDPVSVALESSLRLLHAPVQHRRQPRTAGRAPRSGGGGPGARAPAPCRLE